MHYIICIPANLFIQNPIVRLCTFWPKFYWSLFKPTLDKNRRSIWTIIWNPVPDFGPRPNQSRNRIVCSRDKYYCHSFYQVQGAYAHLNQRTEKDLDEAVQAASRIVYYDDPVRLAVPYEFLMARLPEPPDGLLKSALSLGLILLVYSLMIIKGILRLWLRLLSAYLFQIDVRNIFVRYGRKRRRKPRPIPTLHIKMFATKANTPDEN